MQVEAERNRRAQGDFPDEAPKIASARRFQPGINTRRNDDAAIANVARAMPVQDVIDPTLMQDEAVQANLVDRRGRPRPVEMSTVIAGSNTPDTNNNLNAPAPQSANSWVTQQVDATGKA